MGGSARITMRFVRDQIQDQQCRASGRWIALRAFGGVTGI
jgi:hypothetical protein